MMATRSEPGAERPPVPFLVPVSAASEAGLAADAARLADWLTGAGAAVPLEDVVHTLARRRTHLPVRWVAAASSREELAEALREAPAGPARGTVTPGVRPGVVFVYSGHGSQWTGMGRELLESGGAFADAVAELEETARQECGFSLREVLTSVPLEACGLATAQPAVFALQYGLTRQWAAWGVQPAAVIGHSMGEVTAAVAAGALTPADGLRIVARRSGLMERKLAGTGAIAQAQVSPAEAEELAARYGVSVAVYASPRTAVLAGAPGPMEQVVMDLQNREIYVRQVRGVDIAAHSALTEPILDDMADGLADITPAPARVPIYTTVLDDPRAAFACDTAHWVANIRRPVRFRDAVTAAAADGYTCFLELSGHPAVGPAAAETLEALGDGRTRPVIPSLRRAAPALATLGGAAADLFCHGVPLDWAALRPGGRLADLPTRAWQRQIFAPVPTTRATAAPAGHPFLGAHVRLPETPARHVWQSVIDLETLPWLREHRLADAVVLPGAAFCETALAAACQAFGAEPARVSVEDVDIAAALQLDAPVTLTTTLDEADGRLEISTGDGPLRTVHATARAVRAAEPAAGPELPALPSDAEILEPPQVYARLRAMGQWHGPVFTGLGTLRRHRADGRADAEYALTPPPAGTGHPAFHLHPAFLDSFLHGLAAGLGEESAVTYLPAGLAALRLTGTAARITRARATVAADPATGDLTGTVVLRDAAGTAHCVLEGVRLRRTDIASLPTTLDGKLFRQAWRAAPLPAAAPPRTGAAWLVTGDDPAALATALTGAGVPARAVTAGELAAALAAPADGPRTVVHTAGGPADGPADGDPARAGREAVLAFLATVRAVTGSGAAARLCLLTHRAQALTPGEAPGAVRGGLRGMARTLVLEHPELAPVHLDTNLDGAPLAAALIAELAAPGRAEEVAVRGAERHVAVVRPLPAAAGPGAPRVLARRDGAYVVTGGLRGLGLLTARLLAHRGAGHLVLVGRSGPDGPTAAVLEDLRGRGTAVSVVTGDIALAATVERVRAELDRLPHPLRGVAHAAAAFADRTLGDLDAETVGHVWHAKATGAVRLEELAGPGLDWWLAYSSMASAMGSAGQAAYAAANAFLDARTRRLAAAGIPAVLVNWGQWDTVGSAAGASLPAVDPLRVDEGSAALIHLVESGAAQAGVIRFRTAELAAAYPELAGSPFLSELTGDTGGGTGQLLPAGATAQETAERVRGYVREQVCRIMGFRPSTLAVGKPLVHMGLDSLAAVKIKNAVRAGLSVDLPVALLLQGVTVETLEDHLLATLLPGPAPDAAPAPAATAAQDSGAARARRRDRASLAAQRRQRRSAP